MVEIITEENFELKIKNVNEFEKFLNSANCDKIMQNNSEFKNTFKLKINGQLSNDKYIGCFYINNVTGNVVAREEGDFTNEFLSHNVFSAVKIVNGKFVSDLFFSKYKETKLVNSYSGLICGIEKNISYDKIFDYKITYANIDKHTKDLYLKQAIYDKNGACIVAPVFDDIELTVFKDMCGDLNETEYMVGALRNDENGLNKTAVLFDNQFNILIENFKFGSYKCFAKILQNKNGENISFPKKPVFERKNKTINKKILSALQGKDNLKQV